MTSGRTLRGSRWAGAVLAALAIATASAVVRPPATQAAPQDGRTARLVGQLDRITPTALATWGHDRVVRPPMAHGQDSLTGTIIVVPDARQIWQFYELDARGDGVWNTQSTGLVVLDLDDFRPLHTTELPTRLKRTSKGTPGTEGEWLHAIDGGRRLFLNAVDPAAGNIYEFDLRSFAMKTHVLSAPLNLTTAQTGITIGGMTFDGGSAADPSDDALVLYYGGPYQTASLNGPSLLALRRFVLRDGYSQDRIVRACDGAAPVVTQVGKHYGMQVLLTPDDLFLACHRGGYTTLIVRLPRVSAFDEPTGPERVVAGPVYMDGALVDPGSRRIFVLTSIGELWAFDADSSSFIAVVATGERYAPDMAYGVDPRTGRVFIQSAGYGFGVIEGRFFPVPQAVRVPGTQAKALERIFSDAATGRVFVMEGLATRTSYRIYDTGKAPVPTPPPDADANTADVDEAPGRTEGRFHAGATGYGVRALTVKGWSTIPPTVSVGVPTTGQVINDNVNSACGFTDREMVAAQVSEAAYDTGSSSVIAAPVSVDERTQADLGQPSRCDLMVGTPTARYFGGVFATVPKASEHDKGPGWGRTPASCSSSTGEGTRRGTAATAQGHQSLGTSTVVCPEPGGRLEAHAEAALVGPVSVGLTSTEVKVERTAKGVLSTVTATARDISIADLVRIGEIRSEARSIANGRPVREPMSRHVVHMERVTVRGNAVCGEVCEPRAVAEQLNAAGLGRVEFRAYSGRDERLLKGTPKGALTAVQKSAQKQASDSALFGDPRSELAGFEVIVYNDNTKYGRARQVYQFAGVASSATYNVVPLPAFADLLAGEDEPSRPDGLLPDVEPASSLDLVDNGGLASSSVGTGTGTDTDRGLVAAVNRALRAVADGFRLLVTDPRRAFLVLTAWAVLMAPPALRRRRRLLLAARSA